MEESRKHVEETAGSKRLPEVKTPLTEIEMQEFDCLLERYAKRHPNSDFMSFTERHVLLGFAEFYGIDRLAMVYKLLFYEQGSPEHKMEPCYEEEFPTTET
jgi:hypothetical protein